MSRRQRIQHQYQTLIVIIFIAATETPSARATQILPDDCRSERAAKTNVQQKPHGQHGLICEKLAQPLTRELTE